MPKAPPKVDAERMQRAEEYLLAARELHALLLELPDEPTHYPMAYYQAGLAVECLFRAYAELVGAEHIAGHDLRELAESGKFFEEMKTETRDEARSDLSEVWTRWRNNHRYRPVSALRRFLKENHLYRLAGNKTVRGDVVAFNWNVLLESATRLVAVGVQRWEISKTKWSRLS